MRPISKIFADSQNISDWAKSSVDRAVGNGLITGYPDTTFKPQGNATRAEAAVVLSKSILSAVTPPEVKEPVGEDYSLIDKAGTYEPAGGTETVAGDVTIKAKDTTLQNLHLRWRSKIELNISEKRKTVRQYETFGNLAILNIGKNTTTAKFLRSIRTS